MWLILVGHLRKVGPFSSADAGHLDTIRQIGATSFSRTLRAEERHADYADGAASLLEIEDGPKCASRLLTLLTGVSITDPQPGGYLRSTLVVLIAAIREQLLEELSASGGGAVQRK